MSKRPRTSTIVLAVVFLHILGAVLYFFIGHPKRHTPLAVS